MLGGYSWAGWNTNEVSRQSHPLIKGAPIILRWTDIEPEEGQFSFDEEIGQKLKLAEENEKTILINDTHLKNNRERSADLVIRTDGVDDAVFHIIELNKK